MSSVRRRLLLLALVLALVVLARLVPLAELLAELRSAIERLGLLGPLFFAAVYIAFVLLVLPCFLLGMLAGALFGVLPGLALVLCAATIGATLAFLLGRSWLRPWVERRFAHDARFHAIDEAVRARGWKVIVLLRLSPLVPFAPSNYLYGLVPVRTGAYVLASLASMVPGTLIYVWLGHLGRTGLERDVARTPLEQAWLVLGLLVTIAAAVLLGRLARRALSLAPGARHARRPAGPDERG